MLYFSNMKNESLALLGSVEWCSFDELNIPAVKARVDSGARTSSIQATNIKKFKKKGENWVEFQINPLQDNLSLSVDCKAKIIAVRTVKSSTGISEKRYVIKTPVQVGEHIFDIELTLANRDGMDFRMLLGREAMVNRFVVNPAQQFVLGDISTKEIEQMYSYLIRKKSGLQIGLLASDKSLYSNKRILEAGRARGHEMYFYNIQQCYMRLILILLKCGIGEEPL